MPTDAPTGLRGGSCCCYKGDSTRCPIHQTAEDIAKLRLASAPTGFKGTPGPWRVSSLQEWYIIPGDEPSPICSLAEFSNYGITEHVFPDNNKKQARANAKLIASAPELGSKLSDLQAKFRRGGWRPTLEEMNEIEALLKKAGLLP